jgi:hypothetical protein
MQTRKASASAIRRQTDDGDHASRSSGLRSSLGQQRIRTQDDGPYSRRLKCVLRTAVKWGHLPENPTHSVDLPALINVRPKWALTIAQATALLAELPPLARTMVGLALMSGLRRGEIFALRWRDFDEDWRARLNRTEPESLMFSTWSGKPISPNNVVRQWIVPACKTVGLQRVTWLTLRRTYSSRPQEKGVPGKVIAQLMGHPKVDTGTPAEGGRPSEARARDKGSQTRKVRSGLAPRAGLAHARADARASARLDLETAGEPKTRAKREELAPRAGLDQQPSG